MTRHRSEVFRMIEAVDGVTNCECWIGYGTQRPDASSRVQRLAPLSDAQLPPAGQVLTLAGDGSTLFADPGGSR